MSLNNHENCYFLTILNMQSITHKIIQIINILKKYLYIIIYIILIKNNSVFANKPEIIEDVDAMLPWDSSTAENVAKEIGWWLITTFIKYVAVIAVISLMLSWIMYLLSWWEEEKVKKAKSWIIWSLAWVIFSISAWSIINLINNLQINN